MYNVTVERAERHIELFSEVELLRSLEEANNHTKSCTLMVSS